MPNHQTEKNGKQVLLWVNTVLTAVCLGGGGYIADNVAERFYRDVRLFRLYEGTSQIHLINIAKRTMAAVAAADLT